MSSVIGQSTPHLTPQISKPAVSGHQRSVSGVTLFNTNRQASSPLISTSPGQQSEPTQPQYSMSQRRSLHSRLSQCYYLATLVLPWQLHQMTLLVGSYGAGSATAPAASFLRGESAGVCASTSRRPWSSADRKRPAEPQRLSPGLDCVGSHSHAGARRGRHRSWAGAFAPLFLNNSNGVKTINFAPAPQCQDYSRKTNLLESAPYNASFHDALQARSMPTSN